MQDLSLDDISFSILVPLTDRRKGLRTKAREALLRSAQDGTLAAALQGQARTTHGTPKAYPRHTQGISRSNLVSSAMFEACLGWDI